MGSETTPGRRTNRRYTTEEKAHAVRLVFQMRQELGTTDGTVARVAAQLGYGRDSVRRWVAQAEIDAEDPASVSSAEWVRIYNRESVRTQPVPPAARDPYDTQVDVSDVQVPREGTVTLYALTQAIARYKVAVSVGLALLVLFVLGMSFTFEDGGPAPRGEAKFESGIQISVVAFGTEDLSTPQPSAELAAAASGYADLLSSAEAADVIGQMSGYKLTEPLITTTGEREVPLITATVSGPTSDQAKSAAVNAFEWLALKIQQPLSPVPAAEPDPVPEASVDLDEPFTSRIAVEVDASLASVPEDILVLVDTGRGLEMAVPVSKQAGGTVDSAAILEPNASIRLLLDTTDGTRIDTLVLVPEELPTTAPAFPVFAIGLDAGAVRTVDSGGEAVWRFDSSEISSNWIPGTPAAEEVLEQPQQYRIALITDEPSSIQTAGRRGPLLGLAVLLIGLIGLLTAVIIADTWHSQRIEQAFSEGGPLNATDGTSEVPAKTELRFGFDVGALPQDALEDADSMGVEHAAAAPPED